MNLSVLLAAQNVVQELTMSEMLITSAKVILTGFVVVFAVLILLIFIIQIYGKIIYNVQNSKKKKEEEKTAEAVQAQATEVSESVDPPVVSDGISEEVVAVISAAVATMYSSSGKARIRSIKKSDGSRSAWANAGILDNTRPF